MLNCPRGRVVPVFLYCLEREVERHCDDHNINPCNDAQRIRSDYDVAPHGNKREQADQYGLTWRENTASDGSYPNKGTACPGI